MRANVTNSSNSCVPGADGNHLLVNIALEISPPICVSRNWTAGLKE